MAIDKLFYLKQMGIEPCVPRTFVQSVEKTVIQADSRTEQQRDAQQSTPSNPDSEQPATRSPEQADATMTRQWQTLAQEVVDCKKCVLHSTRTQTVFGVGDTQAQWMFIGEAPGLDEDRKGEPFVGRAGQLLTRMLKAIGFNRREVYIANIVKCRPPDNRNPRPEETSQCLSYLYRQIQLVQPEIIVLLGGVAASSLLKVKTPVSRLRGQIHSIEGTAAWVVVTYHPAYLLRSPQQKAAAWEDLQFACKTIGRELIK